VSLLLDEKERAALRNGLENYLPLLRFERASAEARDVQHALTVLEDALEAIYARLVDQATTPEPPGAQAP